MKILLNRVLEKSGSGLVRLLLEETEDMYALYNLLNEGDLLEALTSRNVVKESNSGDKTKKRMTMKLKINVEKIEFDSEQCSLRVNGRNMEENEHIKLGQYHTIEIEVGSPVTLEKSCWDSVMIQTLEESCDASRRAEVAAIALQDGCAVLCLVTPSLTITRLRVEKNMPKKRPGSDEYEKAKVKFFKEILEGIKLYINFEIVKVILLGSSSSLKDEFLEYFSSECVKSGDVALGRHKGKFVRANCAGGTRRSVNEMLADPSLQRQLGTVRSSEQGQALDGFLAIFSSDPARVCFGPADVEFADQGLAVDQLLVLDSLFRAKEMAVRQRYVALAESVRSNGGRVHIFSALHSTGEKLTLYSGVAAILRYPLEIPHNDDVKENGEGKGSGDVKKLGEEVSAIGLEDNDKGDIEFSKHDQNIVDMMGGAKGGAGAGAGKKKKKN